MRRLVPWFLAGALAASLGAHLYPAGRPRPAVPDGPRAVKPRDIGLTAEQRAQMLCCDG